MWKTEASEQLHSNTFLSNYLCHLADHRADQGVRCKKGWEGMVFEQKGCAKKLPTSSLFSPLLFIPSSVRAGLVESQRSSAFFSCCQTCFLN
ncbi:hypothetical protein CEXT_37041 [Caerostris extrusa]|uniref:Uncharacterized protein n=1 Tax=Caerostris extrusa TaxID=172846 RepID=A0AAV4PB40_CAEEX|nr:hypothetical protein CEXT_37041 [Caerostris extrusa]